MWLVAGLGNPGEKYRGTRHNIGFAVIDELANRWRISSFQKKFRSEVAQAPGAILAKPQTFMNLSGEAVVEASQFFKTPIATRLLVVLDDLDLPVGVLRLRLSGGSGGHNGLKSISELLGTDEYPRLRIGIGRSATLPPDAYVLAKIPSAEMAVYEKIVQQAADGVELVLKEGAAQAMHSVNQRSEVE